MDGSQTEAGTDERAVAPPPVVELLRAVIRLRELAGSNSEGIADLRSLADSLSEITPERVAEVGNALSFAHWQSCAVHVDDPNSDNGPDPFETCTTCAGIREVFNALAALSRIASGHGIAGAGK